jgi:hypothetical protein
VRVLRWFDRQTDEFVGSAPLHGISLTMLQPLFNVDAGDPMYDCFRLGPSQASQLQAFVDVPIQLDRYEYFLEVDAVTPAPARRNFRQWWKQHRKDKKS